MSTAKTLARNTGFLFSSLILDKMLSFFLVIIIARYLGDTGFGKYSFAFAFIGLFTILSHMGLSTYMFKEISKDISKTKKLFNKIFTLRTTILIGLFIIAAIIAWFWPKANEIFFAILLVVIYEFIGFFNTSVTVMFKAHEKNHYVFFLVAIEKGIALIGGWFALFKGYGLQGLICALIISKIIAALYCYIISYKNFIKISLSFDPQLWKRLIKNSLPFWFTRIFQRIYYQTDKIMLTAMKGFAVTGWYSAASTLINALAFIPSAITHSVFPAMSRFHHKGSKDSLKILYRKVFYYLFSIGLPVIIGISMLSERIILFIYKQQFIESSIVLQILSLSLLFAFLNHAMGFLLNAIDKQYLFTLTNGISAGLNILLNLILIYFFSYKGAAFATITTQTISFVLLLNFARKNGYGLNIINMWYRPVIAVIGMGVLIHYIRFMPILYIIPIAVIFYFIILFFVGGLGKEERELIKSFLLKKS